MKLNRAQNNGIPLYIQIAEKLRTEIKSGATANGTRLPGEVQFALDLGVSRATIRQAMSLLVQEGLVRRRKRFGSSVVSSPRIQYTVGSLLGFNEALKAEGLVPQVAVLSTEIQRADPMLMQALELNAGEQVEVVKRLTRLNGLELLVDSLYIALSRGACLTDGDFSSVPLYPVLESRLGCRFVQADQTVSAGSARGEEAHWLMVRRGSPVLRIERVVRSSSGKPLIYNRAVYAAERYAIKMVLQRPVV